MGPLILTFFTEKNKILTLLDTLSPLFSASYLVPLCSPLFEMLLHQTPPTPLLSFLLLPAFVFGRSPSGRTALLPSAVA